MADSIEQLAREMLTQQMEKNPKQFIQNKGFDLGVTSSGNEMKPISADLLATIGGLADAATTYKFLKDGSGKESNALVGFTKNRPGATALAAVGGLLASKGLTKAIGKISPKVAEAVAANLGNLQTQYSLGNLGLRSMPRGSGGSSGEYQRKMQNLAMRGTK